jgi:uncharacterized membrane protein YedE/YeeE
MAEFTPFSAFAGGVILGASALFLLWLNGNVAGISGIVGRLIQRQKVDGLWRWMFVLGLIIGPIITSLIGFSLPESIDVSWPLITVGGLLVGIGSKLGSGCTSGHGICGIGRVSHRSITATIVFMVSALIMVYLVKHLFGAYL